MSIPAHPKIYHIVHIDRLASIIEDGCLWSDAEVITRRRPGTAIGMNDIKARRLTELELSSHAGLHVGECVPFYFCPRSIMLYLLYRADHPNLGYRGGQELIVHLESDLRGTVAWAESRGRRWAFTLSNAGARYFEDRSDLDALNEVDWEAVAATRWSGRGVPAQVKEGKQAEFLVENSFPWHLVERIGVSSREVAQLAISAMRGVGHRPNVEIRTDWYY